MKRKLIQCVSNYTYNSEVQDVIKAISKAGFDGAFIQWMNHNWKFTQQQQLEMCRNLGLEVTIAHLNYDIINDIWLEDKRGDKALKSYLKDIDLCANNNIKTVILHPSWGFVPPKPSKIGIRRLQTLVDYAEKFNIKVAIENAEQKGAFEYIFDNIKNENLGICYDAGHDHHFYTDSFDWLKYKNKIFIVHLHDNDGTADQHLLCFDGSINWQTIINKLKEANYTGDIILENRYYENYADITLQEFYNLSKKRAEKIRKMFKD